MSTRLVQKRFLQATHVFEIVGDTVHVRIQGWFRKQSLSVMLTVLNPEPVIKRFRLEFVSRVNGEALITLFRGKPDAETFDGFVHTLERRALEAYKAFVGVRDGTMPDEPSSVLAGNMEAVPPEFDEADHAAARIRRKVDVAKVDNAIRMLRTYVGEGVQPLIDALEALEADPENEAALNRVAAVFGALGFEQGAVLTYAPYLSVMLSDDPFSNRRN